MAKTRFIQSNFTTGILSPLIYGRTDIRQYYNGLQYADDMILIPQGGIRTRGGTVRLDSYTGNVKLQEFSIEAEVHYLIVFTANNIDIYDKTGTTVLASLSTDYTNDDVATIRAVQAETVMLVFQENHPVKRLINDGTSTGWTQDNYPFTNIPQFDFNDALSPTPAAEIQDVLFGNFMPGDTFQIDVEGVLSKNITYAGIATAAEQEATAENIRKNLQDMPNFGETGVSVSYLGGDSITYLGTGFSIYQFRITIDGESAGEFELFSAFATEGTGNKNIFFQRQQAGSPRSEDVWSETRGYPRNACFYDGRLWIGGTRSKPYSLFASKAGSFFDFDLGEGDADEAIFVTLSSRKLNRIVDVYPNRDLQIFTSGGEFVVDTKPVLPESIVVKPQTSHGAKNLEVKEIDGSTFFIDRFGRRVLNYLYSFNEDAYNTTNPSVLSPELINGPVDMDIQRGTESDDANWVFIVNDDGTVAVLNTLREQDINGFTKWNPTGTNGKFTNVVSVDNEVFFVIEHTVNGVLRSTLCRWNTDYRLDMAGRTTTDNEFLQVGSDYNTETLAVLGDGQWIGEFKVTTGRIELPENKRNFAEYEYGYLFTPKMKPMPINTSIGSGENYMRIKRIVDMSIRVDSLTTLKIDDHVLSDREFDGGAFDTLSGYSGIIEDVYANLGWDRDGVPELSIPNGQAGTIVSIDFEVESS